MKVLVACEFSQVVTRAFRERGHEAYSCDLLPAEGNSEWHIQDDVLKHLDDGWDLMIAHPPCRYLASSGLHWNSRQPARQAKTEEALAFVRALLDAPIEKIALENPIGCISTRLREWTQVISPNQFGHDASKLTCLWLKNLPPLRPTEHVMPHYACACGYRFEFELGKYGCPNCCGDNVAKLVYSNQTKSGQNRLPPSQTRAKERSRTYPNIASAMAEQWG